MRKITLLTVIAVLATVPALAATRNEHKFSLSFTTKATHANTGVTFLTDRPKYKAPPQGQTVDRVATTTFVMAPGTKTNPNAYPACSKKALVARGPSACPKGSKVGSGKAVVITGLPTIDPLNMTAQVFTTRNGLLTYLTGSGISQVITLSMSSNKIIAPVPRQCLVKNDPNCSQGEAVLKRLTVTLKSGKLITTPRACPSSHKWTNRVLYRFANGDTETKTSTSPCKG
jgi:hypothetical protein